MLWIDRLRTDNSLRKLIHNDSTEELVHIEEVSSNVERGGTLIGEQNLNVLEKNIGTYGDDTYSNEDTYEIGDIVTYQGLLYKCILKIDEPEDFNSSHWQNFNLLEEKASVDETENLNDSIETILTQITNLQNELIAKTTRHIITAWTTSDQNVNQKTKINLQASTQVGTKLTLSNNEIIIGSGVSKVKVCGNIFFEQFDNSVSGYLYPRICQNDATIIQAIRDKGITPMTYFQSVEFAPAVINVQENDRICLDSGDINSRSAVVRGRSSQINTWLTVEVVE